METEAALVFHEVDTERWGDLERPFEAHGGPSYLLVHGLARSRGGFVPAFEALGFREVGRAGKRRHVMHLDLA